MLGPLALFSMQLNYSQSTTSTQHLGGLRGSELLFSLLCDKCSMESDFPSWTFSTVPFLGVRAKDDITLQCHTK